MTTAYTSLLGLALPVQGELTGVWGDTVNNSITSLLDTSVAGTTNVSTDTDVTLTTTTGAANTARQAILLFSGARTALRTVTAPAQSKVYTVINATTGGFSVKLVGVGPTTGVTIVAGESAVCAWNGSDFIKISNTGGSASFTNVTVTGTTTLSGLTASTALALDASKNVVSVTNTGTGNNVLSASPTLTGTIGAASLTLSTDLTLSGGTANGVAYLNGSKVVTSGSALTFDGTNLGVGNSSVSDFSGTVLAIHASSGSAARIKLTNSTSGTTSGDGAGITYDTSYNLTLLNRESSGAIIFSPESATEGMRLTSTGLGIGTSSPAVKLQVNGSLAVGSGQNISWGGAYGAGIPTMAGSASGMDFYPAGSTSGLSMRLDSSGNLGLGVTPSAWGSQVKALQSNNGVYFGAFQGGATPNLYLGTNNYFNGTNWIYSGSYEATKYEQLEGRHAWFNAASGTAGNAITFTQAMTLDASSNLQLGTTTAKTTIWSGSGNGMTIGGASAPGLAVWDTSDASYIGYIYQANADTAIGNNATGNLTFATGNTERARITSSGDFLIGTTSTSSKLTVVGSTSIFSFIGSSSNTLIGGVDSTGWYIEQANGSGNSRAVRLQASNGSNVYCGIRMDGENSTINFTTSSTERARIDSSGNLLVGTTSGSHHYIKKASAGSGSAVLYIQGADEIARFAGVTSASNPNAAATAFWIRQDGTTGRSINASGTINAAGADYAEYMTKSGNFTVAKGDVVGIDSQGKLTNVFANAVSFVVKSTDPSYVGGDTWGIDFDDDAEGLEAARQTVDRIAFAGQVPVNVLGATAGQYIIPVNDNGAIKGQAVSNPTFEQYQSSVGKVIAIEADGRARIIVKVA
jgi:hypothetical protein